MMGAPQSSGERLPQSCRISITSETVGVNVSGFCQQAPGSILSASFLIQALTKSAVEAAQAVPAQESQFNLSRRMQAQPQIGFGQNPRRGIPAGPRGSVRRVPAMSQPTQYQDGVGGSYVPKPNQYHFTISDGFGKIQGYVPAGPSSAQEPILRAAVTRLVEDSMAQQNEALVPVGGADSDTLTPPPGYTLRFGGRGLLTLTGPSVNLGPISEQAVANRLLGVLKLATMRDAIDPANKDYPQPDECIAVVEGPSQKVSIDYPCKGGWTDASAKAVASEVGALAKQIGSVNAKVVSNVSMPKPVAPPPGSFPRGAGRTTPPGAPADSGVRVSGGGGMGGRLAPEGSSGTGTGTGTGKRR